MKKYLNAKTIFGKNGRKFFVFALIFIEVKTQVLNDHRTENTRNQTVVLCSISKSLIISSTPIKSNKNAVEVELELLP